MKLINGRFCIVVNLETVLKLQTAGTIHSSLTIPFEFKLSEASIISLLHLLERRLHCKCLRVLQYLDVTVVYSATYLWPDMLNSEVIMYLGKPRSAIRFSYLLYLMQ